MYFIIAFLSTISLSAYVLLISKYARKLDWITLAFYKSLAAIFVSIPFLFIWGINNMHLVLWYLSYFAITAILWTWAKLCYYESQKYLPLWVISSINKIDVLITFILWFLIYSETLSTFQWLGVFIIVASWMGLSIIKNPMPHLRNNYIRWIMLTLMRVCFFWSWLFMIGFLAREINFWIAYYFVELSTFIWLSLLVISRSVLFKKKIDRIKIIDFKNIFMYSILSSIWFWLYSLATTLWPISIVSVIRSLSPIFISIFSFFILNERLNNKQWMLIAWSIGWAVLLKIWF